MAKVTGCEKRRRRKHSDSGDTVLRFMQSKRGYLRPYYPFEYAAVRKQWRDGRS